MTGAESSILPVTIRRMRASLKATFSPSEIVVYPDVPHGCHADNRPSNHTVATEDDRRRLQTRFNAHGIE